jgi:hypothetical protein
MLLQVGLTSAQIINLLVDWNQLPPEYLIENADLTPGDELSDDEKPDQIAAQVAEEPVEPESPDIVQPTEGTVDATPVPPSVAMKSLSNAELMSIINRLQQTAQAELGDN